MRIPHSSLRLARNTVTSLGVSFLLCSTGHTATLFTNARYGNVLREFTLGSTVNQVTGGSNTTNHMDGSGAGDNVLLGSPGTVTRDYILAGSRTVSRMDYDFTGSFDAQASVAVYGSTDGGATYPLLLTSYNTLATDPFFGTTFTPTAVNAVRTVTTVNTQWGGGYYNRNQEVRLYLDTSVSQSLYGQYGMVTANALDYMVDLSNAGKITYASSPNNVVWNALDVGPSATLFNANMYQLDGPRTSGTVDPGQRVYMKLTLDQAYQMDFATLGSEDNPWGRLGNSEFYTYNGASLNPSGLSGSTILDLTGQGWVLQKTWSNDTTRSKSFLLATPGEYNQILLVIDAAGDNRLSNFEMFGFELAIPEPASGLFLALAGVAMLRRRRERA